MLTITCKIVKIVKYCQLIQKGDFVMSDKAKNLTVISSSEFRAELPRVIKRIVMEREHFLVEKNNLPVMVCLSVDEYKKLLEKRLEP